MLLWGILCFFNTHKWEYVDVAHSYEVVKRGKEKFEVPVTLLVKRCIRCGKIEGDYIPNFHVDPDDVFKKKKKNIIKKNTSDLLSYAIEAMDKNGDSTSRVAYNNTIYKITNITKKRKLEIN